MKSFGNWVLIVLATLYVLAPIDIWPGVTDDFIVGLLGFITYMKQKQLNGDNNDPYID